MKAIAKGLRNGIDFILLIGIIVVNVVPFVYMFMMSFKSTINARDFDFSLDKLSFVQYQKIFAMDNFERYIFNSVFVAVAGVILTVTVCSLAGYAFAKMNFKGNDRLFLFLILTMIVPSEVIIVPLFLITKSLGWLNTFRALILPLPTAFGVFIMRQAILDVPQDLINAAKIDGCGNIRTGRAADGKIIRAGIVHIYLCGRMEQLYLAPGGVYKARDEDPASGAESYEDPVQYGRRAYDGLRCGEFPAALYFLCIHAGQV